MNEKIAEIWNLHTVNGNREMTEERFKSAITEALSLKGEEVEVDDELLRFVHAQTANGFFGYNVFKGRVIGSLKHSTPSPTVTADNKDLTILGLCNELEKCKKEFVDYQRTHSTPSPMTIVTETFTPKPMQEMKCLTPEQRQQLFNAFAEFALMEDDFNTIEGIVYPRTYPYTVKDEPLNPLLEEVKKRKELLYIRYQEGVLDDFKKGQLNMLDELIQFTEKGVTK